MIFGLPRYFHNLSFACALWKLCLALSLTILLGCTSSSAESPLSPTSTTVRVIQTTSVPTYDRNLQPVASHLPEATNAAVMDCQSTAGQPMAQHTITADVDYGAHQVDVRQQVRYINWGSDSLPQIVFEVEPNRIAAAFVMETITYRDGTAVPAYELTGRRLEVDLQEALAPGCLLELELRFQILIPPVGEGVSVYWGYFGYSPRQLNLGHWLPTIALRSGGSWITHESIGIGEQLASEIADWDVTFNVSNAPVGLLVAAPGLAVDSGEGRWQFQLSGAREFSASMSPQFQVAQQQTSSGITVEMYSFDDAIVQTGKGAVDGAVHALNVAATSLSMFSDLFGTFAYPRYVVVQGDFPDGMEFSDLVFVSGDWFRTFAGEPASYLTLITIHETAHQWWYARVGSDQAMTPWLDEALATYSEYIYIEEYYPLLKDWWWQFRVGAFVQVDYRGAQVDSSVYQFSTTREYINAVYLRGAQMVDALRRDLGTDVFFDWLRRYAEAGNRRVVTPDLFWSLLNARELALTQTTRTTYLGTPNGRTLLPEATETAELSPSSG
jgi:hypothetical protein